MKQFVKQLFILVIGLAVLAFGIVVMIRASIGADPIAVMSQGIGRSLGIQVGTGTQIILGVMLIVVLILDRKRIGVGTVVHSFILGFMINGFLLLPLEEPTTVFFMLLMFVGGTIIFSVGIALYIYAGLGEGTVDAFMMIMHQKLGLKLGVYKIIQDVACVVIGVLLGGDMGVGTVLAVIFVGPIIQATLKVLNSTKLIVATES